MLHLKVSKIMLLTLRSVSSTVPILPHWLLAISRSQPEHSQTILVCQRGLESVAPNVTRLGPDLWRTFHPDLPEELHREVHFCLNRNKLSKNLIDSSHAFS